MKPGEHQVRERAYYIWEGEGRVFGRADEHWLRAEAEFVAQAAGSADHASLPLTVQSSAPAISDAPSPAKVLKPRSARGAGAGSRAVSAKAEEAARPAGKTAAKAAPAKATASKSPVTKSSVTKSSDAKSSDAKSSDAKSSDAKSSGVKASGVKASTTRTAAGKAKPAPRGSGSSSIALH